MNHLSAGTLCTVLITLIKKGTEELTEIKISRNTETLSCICLRQKSDKWGHKKRITIINNILSVQEQGSIHWNGNVVAISKWQ